MTLQIALCSRQSIVDEVAESLNFAIRQTLLVVTIQCQTFDRLRPRVSVFLPPPRRVSFTRRLSVCLLATSRKTTDRFSVKSLPEMYH